MGVTGLWPILAPSARPTPLPTLNRKRLAVDASIWIYQFLKAVRDKEGNALRNSHVVGFFRRICKLLFFGIKPVFVFDGGAPALKRQTVLRRKQRREGRRDDAVRTAGRLLAVQMKKRSEEEEEKRKRDLERQTAGLRTNVYEEEELPPEADMVYVGEMGLSVAERISTRKFHKKDAYHLPDIPDMADMGQPNDPRVMSAEELEEYARQFNNGEDVNLYDFNKIDFNGEFFMSLPAGDRYNILNAARLRSRLRMGLSKEQLEEMFPDRMAFSKFQIERVRERNELTQRLMNLNGMTGNELIGVGSGRIAGDRGREYVLVKNDGVEGGYALGVVSTEKGIGDRNKPIDVDAFDQKVEGEQEESEDEFEDVPVEGLNRLLKRTANNSRNMTYEDFRANEISEHRGRPTRSRTSIDRGHSEQRVVVEESDELFVDAGPAHIHVSDRVYDEEQADLNRAIELSLRKDSEINVDLNEQEHLDRAIALSMQKDYQIETESENENFEDVPMLAYEQRAVVKPKPLIKAGGSTIAHIVNKRANAAVPTRWVVSDSSGSESEMDLQSTLAKAKKQKTGADGKAVPVVSNVKSPFYGPLPFEKLDFGKSLFGKKQKVASDQIRVEVSKEDDLAGGFDINTVEAPKPLPPWLIGDRDIRTDVELQRQRDAELNAEDREQARGEELLRRKNREPIEIDSDDGSDVEILDEPPLKKVKIGTKDGSLVFDTETKKKGNTHQEIYQASPSPSVWTANIGESTKTTMMQSARNTPVSHTEHPRIPHSLEKVDDEPIKWSESEYGDTGNELPYVTEETSDLRTGFPTTSKSQSPTFEDVSPIRPNTETQQRLLNSPASKIDESNREYSVGNEEVQCEGIEFTENERAEIDAEFDDFSDPEDEELLAQLAIEAEEHARFASTLNNKSERENQEAYERELKALRTQQKKDRRDADEVSHIMITECQALLRLFGLPYITAPMEAEAQCAELVRLGLVDGIVTDDSDIFLFGGTRVYKNMFNSNKYVECYLASDLEKELSLSRDQLISIAHLLGSDYTDGLPGIGPVTAIEIISEFSSENGLEEFKDWWSSAQLSSAPLTSEVSTFRRKFRRSQGTKLFLPPAFPSQAVTDAYLNPDVDSTTEPFQWGVPDLDRLREFLMATIGWSQERTDEVLVPVIRDMNRREVEGTQSNITRFFGGGVGAGANTDKNGRQLGSKRMSDAVSKLKAKKRASTAPLSGGSETWADKAKTWASKNDLSFTNRERAKGQTKGTSKKKGKRTATPLVEEVAGDDAGDGSDVSEAASGSMGKTKATEEKKSAVG